MESEMRFVDTHFHLDLHADASGVIAQCEAARVYTIAVTNAPSVFFHTQQLATGTKYVRAAVGLHPELVASHATELPKLLALMDETRYIGEVGLDYVTSDKNLRETQRQIFSAVLARCAELGGKILTVHSRRAARDVIDLIGTSFPGTVILHWFCGTKKELLAGIDAGCYFSVNPAMMLSERSVKLLADIPRDRILTETDGPFVQVEGRAATPPDVRSVVAGVSKLWGIEPDKAAATIFANFERVLNTPSTSRRSVGS
jgi:TatD DNase family protein